MRILQTVQSICPTCRRILPAQYVERDGAVTIEKTCPEHGNFSVPVAFDAKEYEAWIGRPVTNIPPPVTLTSGATDGSPLRSECPLHCGPCENHRQTTCCVLIDVTLRCNQHCPYCFANAGGAPTDEPSLAEMARKFDRLLELGEDDYPYNIQLSGGEPTVREDLPQIVRMAAERGFPYIQLNTNGKRIAQEDGYAEVLKHAGVSAVFLQFDGVTDDVYQIMRGEPLMAIKERAIENCRRAGLAVSLVPTVVRNVNLHQVGDMIDYLLERVEVVKGIHFQPVSYFGRHPDEENRVTMFDVIHAICDQSRGFSVEDFCPITTGHTLCCFYSTFLKEGDGVTCQLSEETRAGGVSCCDTVNREAGCCNDIGREERLEIIRRDRGYVLKQWEMASPSAGEEPCCCGESGSGAPMDLDQFMQHYKENTFTLTGMAFMDGSNLDAERLSRCRVVQFTDDDRLVPFCAYNTFR